MKKRALEDYLNLPQILAVLSAEAVPIKGWPRRDTLMSLQAKILKLAKKSLRILGN